MGIQKSTMGCSSGKPILTENDKDYIASQTSASRAEVTAKFEEFLSLIALVGRTTIIHEIFAG